MELLNAEELPAGFTYPPEFVRLVDADITHFPPWWIVDGDLLRGRNGDLAKRYPGRRRVLFAVREDSDDVACWDLDAGGVVIVHDFAEPGREQRGAFADFRAWFAAAMDDFFDFDD